LAADDAYRRAIDLDPTNPVLRVRLADRLVAGGKFAEAHTHAVEALRTSPGSLAAIRTLVAACEGEGDIAQAHTWIDQRLARAPDDQALKIVRARLTAAR
jgi:predicted Zn-dependent protease